MVSDGRMLIAIDHHASGVDIEGSLNSLKKAVCDDLGLRGIFCFETSDRFETYSCINAHLKGVPFLILQRAVRPITSFKYRG